MPRAAMSIWLRQCATASPFLVQVRGSEPHIKSRPNLTEDRRLWEFCFLKVEWLFFAVAVIIPSIYFFFSKGYRIQYKSVVITIISMS